VIGIVVGGIGLFILQLPHADDGTMNDTTLTSSTMRGPNPYEVAIVLPVGRLGDEGYIDAIYEGATRAHNDYNINFTYVETESISDYAYFHRKFAAHEAFIEPYDLIIGMGLDQSNAILTVADEYPRQNWAIIDLPGIAIDPLMFPKIATANIKINEGAALVGAIAGLMTETGSVGFLGDIDTYYTNLYAAGFVWAANYTYSKFTNPGSSILHDERYTNNSMDMTLGMALTSEMYSAGADIIFSASGRAGLGAFDAAKEANVSSSYPLWVIGCDVPQMRFGCTFPETPAPPTLGLTSMVKRLDVIVYDLMYAAVLGLWQGGPKDYGIAENALNYEIRTELLTLPSDVLSIVEMIKTGIVNGTFTIPFEKRWMF